MKRAELALALLLGMLAAGCEHLAEANSSPSDDASQKDDSGKTRHWQWIDSNDSSRGTSSH
jgi:hypothetical protein